MPVLQGSGHYSDSPLLRQPISPTTHYSIKNGQKQFNYLKVCCFSSIPNERLTLIFILIGRIVSVLNKRVNMGSKSNVMVLADSLHHGDMRNISTNFGWSNTSTFCIVFRIKIVAFDSFLQILYVIQLSDRVYSVTFPAQDLYSLRRS